MRETVQRNAFFALADNILGCMLADQDELVRKRAISLITEIRENKPPVFDLNRTVPTLNWDANHYSNMIDWKNLSWAELCEPAMTQEMSLSEHDTAKEEPLILEKLYCHTQCVERAVKLVSASAMHMYLKDDRHGSILAGIDSRQKRKKNDVKESYKGSSKLFSFKGLQILLTHNYSGRTIEDIFFYCSTYIFHSLSIPTYQNVLLYKN